MLAALRRRLFVVTWVIVSTQSLVLALGTAQVCANGEHTHAGTAAPDCAMHHHGPGAATGTADVHHGHAEESHRAHGAAAQISCRCSNDVPSTYLGHSGIIERPLVTSPSLQVGLLPAPPAEPCADHDIPPAFPPPR